MMRQNLRWSRAATALLVLLMLSSSVSLAGQAPETRDASDSGFDPARFMADPPAQTPSARDRLDDAVAAARDPLEKATAHAALANWLLSVAPARAATRWLMGMETASDLELLARNGKEAEQQLAKAKAALRESDAAREQRDAVREAIDVLQPFARVFMLAGMKPGQDATHQAAAEAGLDLAIAREADQPAVAASALLWQSFAWSLAGKRDRALSSLPDALRKPTGASYEFLARLLRCRLVAASDEDAAALALLERIRALCEKWYPGESADALQARQRLAGVLQMRIAQAWAGELAGSHPGAVKDLTAFQDGIRRSLFSGPGETQVYTLLTAVPLLVDSPATAKAATQSAPQATTVPSQSRGATTSSATTEN